MWAAPRARTRRDRLAVIGLVLATAAGCGPHGVAPPSGPATPPQRPRPGYERRVDDLATLDASALAGKRIALDPGHGGFFRGALGVHGLSEAEVNLGVALNLRGLLEARGATVLMTRGDDRDFLTPTDSTLRADLTERARLANEFKPDLFLSIHHNADARGAHDVNETQTYYKLGDEGPSLELAQSVHRTLVRNLGIDRHRLMPGNYFVLRTSDAPAILTESSYITNPDVESKLAMAASQRLEAEALLIGIARWCARSAPVVEAFEASAAPGGPPDTSFDDIAAPFIRARIGGAFDEFALSVNGVARTGTRRGQEVEWVLDPLPTGRHEAVVQVRLAAAGSARESRLGFTLRRADVDPEISRGSPPAGPEGGLVALRIEVRDDAGFAIPDSMPVRIASSARARAIVPADTVVTARDGVAWAYLRVAPKTWPAHVRVFAPASPRGNGDEAEAEHFELARHGKPRDASTWLGFALEMPDSLPLRDAPGTREPRRVLPWINRDGYAVLARTPGTPAHTPAVPGFRHWGPDTLLPPRFVAIAGGALHGRRIVLDPDGGGDQAGGQGASGTRAAGLNLEVARALAGFLRAAGADVLLTRDGDLALSDVERVQMSEGFRADRFLRIGHRAETPMIGFYFSSAAGRAWATRVAESLEALGLPAPFPTEDAQYPLQQTSCPALYAAPARVDVAAEEDRLLAPGTLRAEAYALFLALAREWAPESAFPPDSLEVRDAEGRPVPGAAVTLGGGLVLESDASGRVRFARTEPGPLEADVKHARVNAHALLLDSERGVTLTGPPGR